METLRIAILTETLPPSRLGLQPWRYLGDLAQALRKEGHEVTVVSGERAVADWNGVPVDRQESPHDFRSGHGLQRILQARRLDGAVSRMTAGLFFSMREPPRIHPEGRLVGVFLRAVHSGGDLAKRFLDPELAPEIRLDLHHAALFASRRLGTWPDSTAYVGRYGFLWESDRQTALTAGLPAASCVVLRHPFDPAFLERTPASVGPRLSADLERVPCRVVFAGPPEPSRGAGDLVRAIRHFPRDRPVQVVLLVRDPANAEPVVTRAHLGMHEVVTVRGLVVREEIRAVYQSSQVAVFPYRFVRTALPLVALEAAAAGLPVVTTRVHPLRELEGRTGLLFAQPGNPRSLAEAIESALEEGRRAELERRNRAWIQATPSWQEVARSYASAMRT